MKSHVAGSTSAETPTFAQLRELFRQIESGGITKSMLQAFLRHDKIFGEGDVLKSLGYDIIFPNDITRVYGIPYTDEQLQSLAKAFPSPTIMQWCNKKGYVIMPCPPKPMSLGDILAINSEFFDVNSKSISIIPDSQWTFSGWLAVRKDFVPGSIDKSWEEQFDLLDKEAGEMMPSATEIAWFVTTYFRVREVCLFRKVFVRTATSGSPGKKITLGGFDNRMKFSLNNWRRDNIPLQGIAPILRFMTE